MLSCAPPKTQPPFQQAGAAAHAREELRGGDGDALVQPDGGARRLHRREALARAGVDQRVPAAACRQRGKAQNELLLGAAL